MKTKFIKGGVTAPHGFLASGLACGLKKSGKKDLALIYSEVPAVAAGMFTTNKVQAACVTISKRHLKAGKAQAIIANSGNANCMTGAQGLKDAQKMAQAVARALGIAAGDVCVGSTGIIGKPLQVQKIEIATPALVAALSKKGSEDAARSLMTTDTLLKEVTAEIQIGEKKVRIGAIAKGAGMIHPEMALPHATMLCFVSTDALIGLPALRAALESAVEDTFNMITVDGDMSTNDSVIVLANGLAGNKPITVGSQAFEIFAGALRELFLKLAQTMVRDAEGGATKFAEVRVRGARTLGDARIAARAIASSNLVKFALFGADPNWGRIAAAAGQSPAHFNPKKMRIWLGTQLVVRSGTRTNVSQKKIEAVFAKKDISLTVDLGAGAHEATAYTCDLSTKYVVLNSAYHT